jgi:endonuclease/exonuclease/phosphatase family metal-dependent hydrolase
MSLNLRFGRADDGADSWERRKDRLRALLREHPVDFLCAQEVNLFQADFLRECLPGHSVCGVRDPAPAFWQNNVITGSPAWERTGCARFFLSDSPWVPSRFAGSKWPRQCTVAVFRREGLEVACVNTHLDFRARVREAAARVLLEELEGLVPEGAPVVLAGDFNAAPGEPCYRMLTERGFEDVFREHGGGTWHGFTGRARGGRIDWILSRGGVSAVEGRIVTGAFGGGYPSDHFPVMAVFEAG